MKKLLVLGGANPHIKVVEAAKEMGIYVVVADNVENSPAKKIADEQLMIDVYDVKSLIEYCRNNKINGVIDFCLDPAQKPAQEIASALNLPYFGNKEQFLIFTDKNKFKETCKLMNVDTIKEFSIEKKEEIEYSCIVKPSDSRGSRGVFVCNNFEEVDKAVEIAKKEANNHNYVIEKYMNDNQDLTISYIVKNGEPYLVSLGDRYPGNKKDNLDRQLSCTIQPSRFIETFLNNSDKKIKNMIKKVGIKNGPVFFQGFQDGDVVRLYDPGLRFPGNEYERILKKATDVDLMNSLIEYCVNNEIKIDDKKVENCFELGGKVAIQYMINVVSGIIGKIEGLDIISKNSNVIDIQIKRNVGEKIESTGDIRQRIGEISILCNRNIKEMKNIIDFINKNLIVKDTNGNNMLISQFTSDSVDKYYTNSYK